MELTALQDQLREENVGRKMHELIAQLYPICRSITGNGVRETLHILSQHIPLGIHEVPTGTPVFDWIIPKEWNVRDAYIKNSLGEKVVDFQKSNLHLVSYSVPIKKRMPLAELKEHLFTLPDHLDWVPYRTSYYKEDWGICLSHNQLAEFKDEEYEVCIDASLKEGNLTYGEYYLQGTTEDEFLISCHVCHPSLCNDNLSGIALAAYLAKHLTALSLRYSYRFLFIPGTIGSITWLSLNEDRVFRVKHGLVVAGVGDSGKFTYKKSRRGDAEIDRAVIHILKESGDDYEIIDFFPYGYDERQYCSPGFNLPVGCLMRTPHSRYPEYHTSADNLDFVKPEFLEGSLSKYLSVLNIIENNRRYVNRNPKCEPQLGKRKLYEGMEGQRKKAVDPLAMLWVLNMSDGDHSLLDIATLAQVPFNKIQAAARLLIKKNLLREI
jgi:aminopeptidase-like protein